MQETTPDHCSSAVELAGVASEIAGNLGTIFHDLRVEAGYQGPIVTLAYYSLSYSDPTQVAGTQFLELGDRRCHDCERRDRRRRVHCVRGAIARVRR